MLSPGSLRLGKNGVRNLSWWRDIVSSCSMLVFVVCGYGREIDIGLLEGLQY